MKQASETTSCVMPAPSYPHPYAHMLHNQFNVEERSESSQNLFYNPAFVFTRQSAYSLASSLIPTSSFPLFEIEQSSVIRCYNCDEAGHLSRDCKRPRSCYICTETGHVARQCRYNDISPSSQKTSIVARNKKSSMPKQGSNHDIVEYTKDNQNDGEREENEQCLNCNEKGHKVKSCPHPKKCFLCNNTTHVAKDCPQCFIVKQRLIASKQLVQNLQPQYSLNMMYQFYPPYFYAVQTSAPSSSEPNYVESVGTSKESS